MMTLWKWRLYLFVRAADATIANKNALAAIYVNNGSGETLANEKKMFDSVVRFSMTGEEPAQVFGLNLTAQTNMKDEFITFISGLTDPAWVVLANTTLPQYADGEVVMVSDNLPPGAVGMVVDWEQVKVYLFNQFGLREIIPPEGVSALTGSTRAVVIAGRVIPAYTTGVGERIYDLGVSAANAVRRLTGRNG